MTLSEKKQTDNDERQMEVDRTIKFMHHIGKLQCQCSLKFKQTYVIQSYSHVVICRQILLRGCVGLMWKYINYKIFDRQYNIFVNSARTKRTFAPI